MGAIRATTRRPSEVSLSSGLFWAATEANDWRDRSCARGVSPCHHFGFRVESSCSTHTFSTSWCSSTIHVSQAVCEGLRLPLGLLLVLLLLLSLIYLDCLPCLRLLPLLSAAPDLPMATSTLLSRSGSRLILQSANSRLCRSAVQRLQSAAVYGLYGNSTLHVKAKPRLQVPTVPLLIRARSLLCI